MENVKQDTQQHGEATPGVASKVAQTTWLKPTLKRLDLRDALMAGKVTLNQDGQSPNGKAS